MHTNYLIGIAIGCVVVVIGYRLFPPKRENQQKKKIAELSTENKDLKNEFKLEITRNRIAINKLKERIDTLEDRQNKADEWFGSVIRHSRAQFDKQAIEDFLKEQGMKEEL
ncbi:hypothetical protein QUB37_03855 [Microcoleus sp. AT3-A2]|uniref:hypothetical protein n=1 Tax=Microcoleus sp. AT3-A2 TaxID=2818610 RepID=UPI002FD13CAB